MFKFKTRKNYKCKITNNQNQVLLGEPFLRRVLRVAYFQKINNYTLN